ncbi:MAG: hypothetical protein J6K89_03390 [Oscillospiraceae bacterium]|nr:hypothetical protein [Oscillospiraceae bacterium]
MDLRDDYSFCRELMVPNEYILWTGKPNQGTVFSVFTGSSLLLNIVFLGFSYFMLELAKNSDEKVFALLWVAFIAVGIYGLTIWPFQAYYQRKNTLYVITNKQIYRKRWKKITKLSASEMPNYETTYHNNGTATIRFTLNYIPSWSNGETVEKHFSLENLTDVTRAQQAIAQMDTE